MASCLGLYIENNLIKYAKVSKNNNESAKVESFGVKFYDNVESAIKQIIVLKFQLALIFQKKCITSLKFLVCLVKKI